MTEKPQRRVGIAAVIRDNFTALRHLAWFFRISFRYVWGRDAFCGVPDDVLWQYRNDPEDDLGRAARQEIADRAEARRKKS